MRAFPIGLLALVFVSLAVAQAFNPRETMTVGVDLTLGMSEDAAVKKLTEAGYRLRKSRWPSPINLAKDCACSCRLLSSALCISRCSVSCA
jgi:hypothetical protein